MDYRKADVHILADDLPELGPPYIGKLIVIKGVVTRTDTTDPDDTKIFLNDKIVCELGNFKAMAQSKKEGDTIFLKGYLKSLTDKKILLSPAIVRDSKSPFDPLPSPSKED